MEICNKKTEYVNFRVGKEIKNELMRKKFFGEIKSISEFVRRAIEKQMAIE